MKQIFRHIMAAAIAAVAMPAVAQNINSAYFTKDYKYRHDLNPAFGADQGYISMPVLGNLNLQLQGNFGYKDLVFDNPMYPAESNKSLTSFMNPYISASDALGGLSKGNNRILANIGLNILSAGFKGFGGYNTIELSSKTSLGLSLPYELFEFAKNTGNRTYDIGDIDFGAQSYVELALGHSRQINDRLRVGAKVKLLFGIARADFKMADMKADLSAADKWTVSGQAVADVSLKGFQYQSEEEDYNVEGAGTYTQISDMDVDGFGLGGFGMAFDLGGVYKIDDDWTVSASVLDLGFISWSNNARAESSGKPFVFDGFHDISVTDDRGEEFDVKADRYADQLLDFAHLEDKGSTGGRSTGIGATINAGVEYTLPVYRPVSFGFLSSTRINGPYTWTEGRLSANYTPLKWIDGGISFAVNSFATSCGWVLNIHPQGYNFFIGMDHILGKLSKDGIPLSSNASLSLGMSVVW